MRQILLCGRSLWLGGFALHLRATRSLQVTQEREVSSLYQPPTASYDMVILERERDMDVVTVLRAHPTTLVLSVDVATGEITALSGQTHKVQTLEELTQIICNMMALPAGHRLITRQA